MRVEATVISTQKFNVPAMKDTWHKWTGFDVVNERIIDRYVKRMMHALVSW